MPKSTEVYVDGQGRRQTREVGTDEDLLVKDKVQDVSGLAAKAAANKNSAPAKEEEDPSKMSPMQRAAYNAKKRREAPAPLDEQEKKASKKNQLSALTGK